MVEATVDLVDRGRFRTDLNHVLAGHTTATPEQPRPEHDLREFVIYNAVVDHPEGTVLWDTGVNPGADRGYWPEPLAAAFRPVDAGEHYLENDLDAAGYDIRDVDAVVLSHLHVDHAGGLYNFDGTDVPVYVHGEEFKYAWYSARTDEGSRSYLSKNFDHDLNWTVLHRDRETRFEDVTFLRLPGHTPGLLGMRVDLPGTTLLFTSDQAYAAENYVDGVPPGTELLWSRPDWLDSLRLLREEARTTGAEVVYGHDADRFAAVADGWG